MQDSQFKEYRYHLNQIEHAYGEKVHILQDPTILSLLTKISQEKTQQPLLTELVKKAYHGLFNHISSQCFELGQEEVKTRMYSSHKEATLQGQAFDSNSKFAVVDLARAGIIPAQLIYNELNYLFSPQNVRQDHFYAARMTNEKNEVTGIDISGSKIGGDIEDRYLILPDPMGATGGTICESIKHYKNKVPGEAKKIITAHLIITPEYIQRVKSEHPDVEIFTIRLDRGLSSKKALSAIPGTYIDEEKGLNENQYIVPGAGGVGELLNNSFV
jgi:uracil phosphoribosyltransferase